MPIIVDPIGDRLDALESTWAPDAVPTMVDPVGARLEAIEAIAGPTGTSSIVDPVDARLTAAESVPSTYDGLNLDHFTSNIAMQGWYHSATYPPAVHIGSNVVVQGLQGFDYPSGKLMNRVRVCDNGAWEASAHDAMVCWDGYDDHSVGVWLVIGGRKYCVGGVHNHPMRISYETTPGDPTTFTAGPTLSDNAAYPHTFEIDPLTIGNLFRKVDSGTRMGGYYVKATLDPDTGAPTWGSERQIFDLGDDNRCYFGSFDIVDGKYYGVLTRANYADTIRQDVFAFVLDPATDTINNLAGTHSVAAASWPISLSDAQTYFRLVDQTDNASQGQIPSIYANSADDIGIIYIDGLSAGSVRSVYYLAVLNGVAQDPVLLATSDTTTVHVTLATRSTGEIEAWYTKPSAYGYAQGGDVYRRVRSAAGVWGAEELIRSAGPLYALGSPTRVQNGPDYYLVAYSEILGTATTGIENGRALMGYAHGVNGPVRDATGLHASTAAVVAALDVPESNAFVRDLDTLIKMFDEQGHWALAEAAQAQSFQTEEGAMLDLTGRHTFALTGNAEFVPGVGYTPDGASARMSFGFNPKTSSGLRIQPDNLCIEFYVHPDDDGQEQKFIIGTDVTGNSEISIVPRTTSDTFTARVTDLTSSSFGAVTHAKGYSAAMRTDANTKYLVRETAATTVSLSETGSNLGSNGAATLWNKGATFSAKRVLFAMWGKADLGPNAAIARGHAITRWLHQRGILS